MNQALPNSVSSSIALPGSNLEEVLRIRRLRSLLALFSLYAAALLSILILSDGPDIGCVLAGVAGHVIYATIRLAGAWRDDLWLEDARARFFVRRRRRLA